MLGTSVKTIITTEDKGLFVKSLSKINVKTPKSFTVHSFDEGIKASKKIHKDGIIHLFAPLNKRELQLLNQIKRNEL